MSPPDVLETPRLRAERLVAADRDVIHAMHRDAEQMALLGGVRTAAQTAEYMAANLRHWDEHGFGVWILRDRLTSVVTGRAILRHLDVEGVDEVEVGYSLLPVFWGAGLATEITKALLRHGFASLDLTSVVAVTTAANTRSQRVLEKAGLALERDVWHAGAPHLLYRVARPGIAQPPGRP